MEPIGVKIPITMGNIGFFNQTFTSLEEAKSNLLNLLLTRRGERVMHPEFGTDIYNLLFTQITRDLKQKIGQEIRTSVETWIPYILLTNVEVDISDENIENNRIDIRIGFGLKRNINEYDEIIVTFLV